MSERTRELAEAFRSMADDRARMLTAGQPSGAETRDVFADRLAQLAAEVDRLSNLAEPLA